MDRERTAVDVGNTTYRRVQGTVMDDHLRRSEEEILISILVYTLQTLIRLKDIFRNRHENE